MRQWGVAAAVLLAVACDETPTTPSAQEIAGRWVVERMQPLNGATITPPSGVVLAIDFAGDRISVQGDCNVCSGRYTLTGRTLTLSPLACTRRACREGSLEGPFFDLLATAQSAQLVPGPLLLIESQRGRIVLRR